MDKGTRIVLAGFRAYSCPFERLTAWAPRHLQRQDVDGIKRDYIERLDFYGKIVSRMAAVLDRWIGAAQDKHAHWATVKEQYAQVIVDYPNRELAGTRIKMLAEPFFRNLGAYFVGRQNRALLQAWIHIRPYSKKLFEPSLKQQSFCGATVSQHHNKTTL